MTTIEALAVVLSEQQVQISELLKTRRLDASADPSDYDVPHQCPTSPANSNTFFFVLFV
jgi:hypothetical protein